MMAGNVFAAMTIMILLMGTPQAQAQTSGGPAYPHKPMRIVTGGVGGGSDFTARLVAQGLSAALGQQVIVDNRASGVIPGTVVSRAPPDGHTLLIISGTLWLSPFFQANIPFDALRDFAQITMVNRSPNVVVVHPSLPVNSINELIAFAKSTPGGLNYSTGATGSSAHLAGELFNSMTGIRLVRIPYSSGATEIADLLSGQVKMTFGSAASVTPHVKSGKLKAIAVTSPQPSALAPGLPTVASSGLPGFDSGIVTGLMAPARTPAAIINRLHDEVVRYVGLPQTRERLLASGVEPVGNSPREYTDYIRVDIARWSKVLKEAGIVPE
jgi:tripartite-type tricarboxylate transporter receptor subunit TctC